MRNYIHILRNLPGILKRLEDELRGKASAASVSALCADMNSLNRRLADRPTKADLTIVEGDLGARIEKLEAMLLNTGPTGEDLREGIRNSIRNSIMEALEKRARHNLRGGHLNAEPTGGPNLMDVLAKVKAEKAGKPKVSEALQGLKTVDVTVDGKASDPVWVGVDMSAKDGATTAVVTKPTKPRKPRTPKGGGK